MPHENDFKVAFVFGKKASDQILQNTVNEHIKAELSNAQVYAEGRSIHIDIDGSIINDIKRLMEIKLAYLENDTSPLQLLSFVQKIRRTKSILPLLQKEFCNRTLPKADHQ